MGTPSPTTGLAVLERCGGLCHLERLPCNRRAGRQYCCLEHQVAKSHLCPPPSEILVPMGRVSTHGHFRQIGGEAYEHPLPV